jgi:hypothetical protein
VKTKESANRRFAATKYVAMPLDTKRSSRTHQAT